MKISLILGLSFWMFGSVFAQSVEENQLQTDKQIFERIEPESGMSNNPEPVIYEYVDKSASFQGGSSELLKYLSDHVHYPEIAQELGLSGQYSVRFIVSENGYISNVHLIRNTPNCPECDAEIIRVIKSMPRWIPAKINGKAVNSWFVLPVTICLK